MILDLPFLPTFCPTSGKLFSMSAAKNMQSVPLIPRFRTAIFLSFSFKFRATLCLSDHKCNAHVMRTGSDQAETILK